MNTENLLRPFARPGFPWPTAWIGRWLRAARDGHRQGFRTGTAGTTRLHESLLELDARVLRDIGAPPALQARALRRREAQRERLDDLRAGGAAGDWQGW